MKKLKVITEKDDNIIIHIDNIDLKKHLVVYNNFEEILCKCENGYIFVAPSRANFRDKPQFGSFHRTIEDVFAMHGCHLRVYEI